MSDKNLKKLPLGIGNDSFIDIITKGGYYVDKTSYIKKVFTNISPVILFTRPRRFGKTLLMDMEAGKLLESQNKNEEALALYEQIKSEYPTSTLVVTQMGPNGLTSQIEQDITRVSK